MIYVNYDPEFSSVKKTQRNKRQKMGKQLIKDDQPRPETVFRSS